jgi:hypothetical protein
MSYSFLIIANTKGEATRRIGVEFDKIVEQQPRHQADREATVLAAQALVGLLAEPAEDEEIEVSVGGSLGRKEGVGPELGWVNVGICVMLAKRVQANSKRLK